MYDLSELHIPKSNWTFADPNSVVGACLPSSRPPPFRVGRLRSGVTYNSLTRRTALSPVDDSQDVFGERDQVSAPHRAHNAEKEAHDRLSFTA